MVFSLPYKPTMLPGYPLFTTTQIIGICEAEFVFWIVVPGEVCKNSSTLKDGEIVLPNIAPDDGTLAVGVLEDGQSGEE